MSFSHDVERALRDRGRDTWKMRLHVRPHNERPTAENIVSGLDKRIFGRAWLSVYKNMSCEVCC